MLRSFVVFCEESKQNLRNINLFSYPSILRVYPSIMVVTVIHGCKRLFDSFHLRHSEYLTVEFLL